MRDARGDENPCDRRRANASPVRSRTHGEFRAIVDTDENPEVLNQSYVADDEGRAGFFDLTRVHGRARPGSMVTNMGEGPWSCPVVRSDSFPRKSNPHTYEKLRYDTNLRSAR